MQSYQIHLMKMSLQQEKGKLFSKFGLPANEQLQNVLTLRNVL